MSNSLSSIVNMILTNAKANKELASASSSDLDKLTSKNYKQAGFPYRKGEVKYDMALTTLKTSKFNLYHSGPIRFGLSGLHWTADSQIAKNIHESTGGKLATKTFSKSDKFKRINDSMEANNIIMYAEELKEKDLFNKLLSVFAQLGKNKYNILQAVQEISFRKPTKEEQLLIDKALIIFVKYMKSKNLRGLVYWNEFEGGGDSFITFW